LSFNITLHHCLTNCCCYNDRRWFLLTIVVYNNINKIHWQKHHSPLIFQLATKVMNMQPTNSQDVQSLERLMFSLMNSWKISSFMKVEVQKIFFVLIQTYCWVLKTMWKSFPRDSMFLTNMRLKLWQMKRITSQTRLTHGHAVLLMHGCKVFNLFMWFTIGDMFKTNIMQLCD